MVTGAQERLWTDPWPDPIGWFVRVGEHEWLELDKDGNEVDRHTTSAGSRTHGDAVT